MDIPYDDIEPLNAWPDLAASHRPRPRRSKAVAWGLALLFGTLVATFATAAGGALSWPL